MIAILDSLVYKRKQLSSCIYEDSYSFGGSCFNINFTLVLWENAKVNVLPVASDTKIMRQHGRLTQLKKTETMYNFDSSSGWIGAMNQNGYWQWDSDGKNASELFDLDMWATGHPVDGQHCAVFVGTSKITTDDCSSSHESLCMELQNLPSSDP
ncbi:hypothetical protein Btru_070600 [Bulinus truncatus]|nr:hypothetical protein Btru_070600 [Bulinus truncatus]